MSFETLGLSPAILRALAEQEYTTPTPIQAAAIPVVLSGRDLLAGAQTGTGKTAAFALPLLERLFVNPPALPAGARRKPRALILTPTRELAAQVHESLRGYAKHLRMSSTQIFGGVGMGPQVDALRRGVDVLVATPSRLLDHMEAKARARRIKKLFVLTTRAAHWFIVFWSCASSQPPRAPAGAAARSRGSAAITSRLMPVSRHR